MPQIQRQRPSNGKNIGKWCNLWHCNFKQGSCRLIWGVNNSFLPSLKFCCVQIVFVCGFQWKFEESWIQISITKQTFTRQTWTIFAIIISIVWTLCPIIIYNLGLINSIKLKCGIIFCVSLKTFFLSLSTCFHATFIAW